MNELTPNKHTRPAMDSTTENQGLIVLSNRQSKSRSEFYFFRRRTVQASSCLRLFVGLTIVSRWSHNGRPLLVLNCHNGEMSINDPWKISQKEILLNQK